MTELFTVIAKAVLLIALCPIIAVYWSGVLFFAIFVYGPLWFLATIEGKHRRGKSVKRYSEFIFSEGELCTAPRGQLYDRLARRYISREIVDEDAMIEIHGRYGFFYEQLTRLERIMREALKFPNRLFSRLIP